MPQHPELEKGSCQGLDELEQCRWDGESSWLPVLVLPPSPRLGAHAEGFGRVLEHARERGHGPASGGLTVLAWALHSAPGNTLALRSGIVERVQSVGAALSSRF